MTEKNAKDTQTFITTTLLTYQKEIYNLYFWSNTSNTFYGYFDVDKGRWFSIQNNVILKRPIFLARSTVGQRVIEF